MKSKSPAELWFLKNRHKRLHVDVHDRSNPLIEDPTVPPDFSLIET